MDSKPDRNFTHPHPVHLSLAPRPFCPLQLKWVWPKLKTPAIESSIFSRPPKGVMFRLSGLDRSRFPFLPIS